MFVSCKGAKELDKCSEATHTQNTSGPQKSQIRSMRVSWAQSLSGDELGYLQVWGRLSLKYPASKSPLLLPESPKKSSRAQEPGLIFSPQLSPHGPENSSFWEYKRYPGNNTFLSRDSPSCNQNFKNFLQTFPLHKMTEFKTGCYLSYFKITDEWFSKINLFLSYTAIRGNADPLS